MDKDDRQRAFDGFEKATELPLLILALAIIPLLLTPLAFDLSAQVDRTLLAVGWVIWAVFALELVVKTYLSPKRLAYLGRHWFDIVIVAIPFLRALRVVRSARALRTLRAGRALAVLWRCILAGRRIAARNGLQYAMLVGIGLVFACAGAVTLFERDSGGNITDFGTAMWWASTTVTTVGYGDTFPKTPEGRGVAVLLMLVGITLFSLLTANIAAFFVEANASDGPTLDDVMLKLAQLEEQIGQLQEGRVTGGESR